jgi:hypothetical protein
MTAEILILVAVWCGNPSNPTYYPYSGWGANTTIENVNKCREKLRQCLVQKMESFHPLAYSYAAQQCTAEIPYPGQDLNP